MGAAFQRAPKGKQGRSLTVHPGPVVPGSEHQSCPTQPWLQASFTRPPPRALFPICRQAARTLKDHGAFPPSLPRDTQLLPLSLLLGAMHGTCRIWKRGVRRVSGIITQSTAPVFLQEKRNQELY